MIQRSRCIRDPIHGDVRLRPIEAAVVDSRIFQRLRYIRQNGLLHFVFPGAVHTRFAHSIGTMHIAGRVAEQLFGPLTERADARGREAVQYLSTVFRLSALLHDVGHCAFSHSIEHVTYKGEPLLGTTRELLERWGERELLAEILAVHPEVGEEPVTHEQIGLVLTRRIFEGDAMGLACAAAGMDAQELGRDVRAIMDGGLGITGRFAEHSLQLPKLLGAEIREPEVDISGILHALISGTLDVDRLDYLIRDSHFCGVPYGRCDVALLIRSLSLGVVESGIVPMLHRKAAHALDDMLWSRYQLFLQVYNHKTNVGLNAALASALFFAIAELRIRRPQQFNEFIAFIDDHILGNLFFSAELGDLDDRWYTRVLVDREVPKHLRSVRISAHDDPSAVRAAVSDSIAREIGIAPSEILVGSARSTLLKSGLLLRLVDWNHRTGELELEEFDLVSSVIGDGKFADSEYHVLHFFTDRRRI
ncbi:MAG TPA: HD domain-containing protein [Enhygromyxa sp.]|nr:HD domain-containing protein [Enhygromyxa sp.]